MILVIGGMGFIGLNTAIRLLEQGEDVVITQHSANRVPDVIKDEVGKRVLVERMDVTNSFEVNDVFRRHQHRRRHQLRRASRPRHLAARRLPHLHDGTAEHPRGGADVRSQTGLAGKLAVGLRRARRGAVP